MLRSFSHTGLGVADLEVAVELYESLGFRVTKRFHKDVPDSEFAWVEKGDVAIELVQFNDESEELVQYIRNHIAFMSDDLESDVQSFLDKGWKLVIPINDGMVLRFAYVQDPAGAVYEIATEKSVD